MCGIVCVKCVNGFLDVARHPSKVALRVRGDHDNLLDIGLIQISLQILLRHKIVGKHDVCPGFLHGLNILFQRVVTAQQGSANFFRSKKEKNELWHRFEKNGNLIPFTQSKGPHGTGHIGGLCKEVFPH